MSVLITAGLSPEAYRLQRTLNITDVVFTDESRLPEIPGIHSLVLPAYNSPSFVHETLKACLDQDINRIYPLKWGEVIELSKARALFSEYNVRLIIPSNDWLKENRQPKGMYAENIIVLENGQLTAGAPFPGTSDLKNETGIFRRATSEQVNEYSLYVVDDAGI